MPSPVTPSDGAHAAGSGPGSKEDLNFNLPNIQHSAKSQPETPLVFKARLWYNLSMVINHKNHGNHKVSSIILLISSLLFLAIVTSCKHGFNSSDAEKEYEATQNQYRKLLESPDLIPETRYGLVKSIATGMHAKKDYTQLILFLTEWVENHPDDTYNAYWLLMTANAYLENDAKPMAEYYFERILHNYDDLVVQEKSVHYLCLQHLIQISTVPANRISYFNQLITRFPNEVSITELYVRMALEYENEGEWPQALRCFQKFLEQDDAATIQISGIPNAYMMARQLIDFNKSSKDWTFETLDGLVSAVRRAINNYDPWLLESYKSKVNFFSMSWRQDETADNAQSEFSMGSYMVGNTIRCSSTLDETSTPTEAYLRTWGWTSYLNVWYFYFRKVNFPADPDIHGRWEWAGIYFGEKL
jgi:tetratricopeptide (TPR) repeat protein